MEEKSENVFTDIRTMDSGATRTSDKGKFNYEGFFNPGIMAVYANYLNKHRVQADGKLRDADNWQKGMPLEVYMESAIRHLIDAWAHHRGYVVCKEITDDKREKTHYVIPGNSTATGLGKGFTRVDPYDSLCAILFNINGYILEMIRKKGGVYAD